MILDLALIYKLISFYMVGVIWIIQLIHYPAFLYIEQDKFKSFHLNHTQKLSYIVGPAMILELGLSAYLGYQYKELWNWQLISVLLIWACTFFISVPIHSQLENGYDTHYIKKLILTNWPRTVIWTFKAIILLK